MISTGALRRLTHPILLRCWLKMAANTTVRTKVGGFVFRVSPSVFHPRYFGSSSILGRYVTSLDLKGKRFLDMGTGSGVIALFAARSGADVVAVDINPAAVECARENAFAAGLLVECRISDLFSNLDGERFDVIAWNPPFFPQEPRTVAEVALYAGKDYAVIVRFARAARSHLKTGGAIVLVLSMDLDIAIVEKMFEAEGFSVRRVIVRRWALGESMVVIEVR